MMLLTAILACVVQPVPNTIEDRLHALEIRALTDDAMAEMDAIGDEAISLSLEKVGDMRTEIEDLKARNEALEARVAKLELALAMVEMDVAAHEASLEARQGLKVAD